MCNFLSESDTPSFYFSRKVTYPLFNAGYSAVISEILALKFFACPTLKAYCFQSENNGSIKMRKFPESICDKYYESDGKL